MSNGSYNVRTSIPSGYNPYYMSIYGNYSSAVNTCILGNASLGRVADADVLPNCTGYAQGRANEILTDAWDNYTRYTNYFSPFSGNAGAWADTASSNGYSTGSVPRAGAIVCWGNTYGAGHVAVVEQINSDGSILLSESGWNNSAKFDNVTVDNSDGKWGISRYGSNYYFRCFIYQPVAVYPGELNYSWSAKTTGGYLNTSDEAIGNAYMTYYVLSQLDWSVNAVAGLLGNIQVESELNPWRWENDTINTSRGYGLVQFTPATKYINSSYAQGLSDYAPYTGDSSSANADDGTAQLQFVDNQEGYYATSSYNLSYAEFKASTESASYLASAWLYNYERPANPSATESLRQEYAEYWYEVLQGYVPPTTAGGKHRRSKYKICLYLKNLNNDR